MPFQYGNPANPRAHEEGTGEEIVRDLPGITHFVAGLGTGGTLTGVGRRLKRHDPKVKMIAAEPELGDLVYGLRSLDDGFVPPIFDESLLDRKFLVNVGLGARDARAHRARGHLRRHLVGGGAPRRPAGGFRARTRRRRVLLADGWKYLSTQAWAPELERAEKNVSETLWW